ncbi:ribonuclease HII [Rhodosalinus halophilus]|uniref:Ribonuclease HII n=1 Tax=Rhodosalinus halophilus TaxID=2259333 RepID=A0A365UCC4_9RHOB|nr:ribonuclease HII [Rhodosalinus halophilus]RBI86278.1 ribonuclease HII [Rhodosalinus halophilus]
MDSPDCSFERAAVARGARFVAGVDEAGRGPLAGPVTAAAVVLDLDCVPDGIHDSKLLPAERRAALAAELAACATVAVAHASVEEIDALNILAATELAMCRAVAALPVPPCHLLIDGNRVPQALPCAAEAVVGGDGRVLSIAAASIAAKVARDAIMVELAQQYPGYGWETNKGYGSKSHIAALQDLGVTPHHRRSFAPVHNILYQGKSVSL